MEDIYETTRPITSRQKMAVDYWITDGRRSKANSMRKAGYSSTMCRQPHKVFNSPAVKNELYLLGYGYAGKSIKSKPPKGFSVSVKKPEPKFDTVAYFRSLPKEQIQDFLEVLDNTEPRPKALERMERKREEQNRNNSGYSIPKNDPNCNIFGERLPNRPEPREEMNMSDLSCI